jgi:membrane fusion protein, copper/silver efflux system
MTQKWLYSLPLVVALLIGFMLGHVREVARPNEARKILYYKDPMHPAYRSDKPGIAPDCGMELVPVYAKETASSLTSDQKATPGVVEIDPAILQLYGIKLAKAQRDSGQGTVLAFARVEADETRVFRVNFGTDGYVKETHNDAIGDYVVKNQHLATVYSPDFLSVAGGYLAANEIAPASSNMPRENYPMNVSQGTASVQARADRLRNLGMSDDQIEEISKTHKLPEDVYVVSPANGFILSRSISSGMRFERSSDLYTIADLSHIWIIAEVFGRDRQALRPGVVARVTLSDTNESFRAIVTDVLPEVDPVTRASKLRLQADNPGFKLRPNMFVNVELPVTLPPGISVPADAVLDSGLSKRVFVQISPGQFESRAVKTGWSFSGRVQIVEGLHEGEVVVSSGNFLVDSESKLQLIGQASNPVPDSSRTNTPIDRRTN